MLKIFKVLQIQTIIAYKTKKHIKTTWSTRTSSLAHISMTRLSIKVCVIEQCHTRFQTPYKYKQ